MHLFDLQSALWNISFIRLLLSYLLSWFPFIQRDCFLTFVVLLFCHLLIYRPTYPLPHSFTNLAAIEAFCSFCFCSGLLAQSTAGLSDLWPLSTLFAAVMQHRMIKDAQKGMGPWMHGQPMYAPIGSNGSSQGVPILYSGGWHKVTQKTSFNVLLNHFLPHWRACVWLGYRSGRTKCPHCVNTTCMFWF